MEKFKVLDLFSGIGGFSLGLERTGGFETVAFCEIDEHCRKVLHKNFQKNLIGGPPIFSDIERLHYIDGKLTDKKFPLYALKTKVDVICGGFPCQDISTGNVNGKGLEGERSGLWSEYKRLIEEVRPKYAIIENVANLRSRGLSRVLKDLWTLGFDCEWNIISACSVGALHRRERIWLVAYESDRKLERTTPDPDSYRFGSAFASEEERREWRTATAARFGDVLRQVGETSPVIRGEVNGFPAKLDAHRRRRIEQLGNAVVPQIPQLIGEFILDYERRRGNESND